MKFLISLLLFVALFYGCNKLVSHWESVRRAGSEEANAKPAARDEELPGLPPSLEPSLQAAKKEGYPGLKNWLQLYRPYVADPRLASIELDYVVLLWPHDRAEARRIFAEVRRRAPPNSPVYQRIKLLEKTYQ